MENNFSAKKSLGQHFLHAPNVVGAMVHAARIGAGDLVLEIGPGKGVLTRGLLKAGAKVIAVEVDPRSVEYMKEHFQAEISDGALTVVEKDILQTEPRELGLERGKYAIAANIPYYITGEIIRKFLTAEDHPSRMVLLVQKEVAKRIVAADGKESILSLSVKAYGEPKYVVTVPKRSFRPMPKVDSAVIFIDKISKSFFETEKSDEKTFFEAVRAGFAHKRKILMNNLAEIMPKETVKKLWTDMKWLESARAENLTLGQWKEIALFHRNKPF